MGRSGAILLVIFAFAVLFVSQFGNASPSDVVAEVKHGHSHTSAVAEQSVTVLQSNGRRVVSTYYRKHLIGRKLQHIPSLVCEEQTCEILDDCIDYAENCVCDEQDEDEGNCYLEIPCDTIPCATDKDCTSAINQLCKCPQGGGNCYDQLIISSPGQD